MRSLNILICGSDRRMMQGLVQRFGDGGVNAQACDHLIDNLCCSGQEWDFLLIDLDRLDSFLRTLLSAVRYKFPDLPMIGISTKSVGDTGLLNRSLDLKLDTYFSGIPRPEELIVRFPQISAKYLFD